MASLFQVPASAVELIARAAAAAIIAAHNCFLIHFLSFCRSLRLLRFVTERYGRQRRNARCPPKNVPVFEGAGRLSLFYVTILSHPPGSRKQKFPLARSLFM